MSKGIELPINTLIILSIAIIVLITMVLFFVGGSKAPTGAVQQASPPSGCTAFVQANCCSLPANAAGCTGFTKAQCCPGG